jgi:hypothetical protein
MVEVMGRYSNSCEQGERLRELLEMAPSGPPKSISRTIKQVQRRLRPDEVGELITNYQAGIPINDLAARFGIHRHTVLEQVKRLGLRRRYPSLGPDEVERAAQLYRSGQSLAVVGEQLGWHASTVRHSLLKVGVQMRDSQGRAR